MALTLASAAHAAPTTDTPKPHTAPASATKAGPAPEASAELLEFLGGVDNAPPDTVALPEEPPTHREPDGSPDKKMGVTP
jgi:hypothetical protein